MSKFRLTALSCALIFITSLSFAQAQEKGDVSPQVVFRFVSGNDMLYVPWNGNGDALNALCASIDVQNLAPGAVKVDGYSETKRMSLIRCNRVKSELIVRRGMSEHHFTTTNNTGEFNGLRNVVIVTLPVSQGVPAKEPVEKKTAEPTVTQQPPREQPTETVERKQEAAGRKAVVEQQLEPVVETQPGTQTVTSKPAASFAPYCFAVRTNLLYDAFLLPTLGVEWRVNSDWGVKLDGSLSWWGNEHGKVQKMWLVSPEVRRYMGGAKRFYLGASGNYGRYNIYKGMLGGLFSGDTGYQGKLWNAGLTAGYQLSLSRAFSLDFNLGLGYTSFGYDSYTVTGGVRVYKDKDKSKDLWGVTQAGVSLVWTIGGNKQ